MINSVRSLAAEQFINIQKAALSFLFLLVLSLFANPGVSALDPQYVFPMGSNRGADLNQFQKRIIGRYGDNRQSEIRGHRHAGIDIQGVFNETVYSIGAGTVAHIFGDSPHKTVIIWHSKGEAVPFYSVYMHVEDIRVSVGDFVAEATPVARIFSPIEMEHANFGTPPHLHFEIRHNACDGWDVTFRCMSMDELNTYFIDPLMFFEKRLRKGEDHEQ